MKIYLVDNDNLGHHKLYQDTLNKICNTEIKNIITNFIKIKSNPLKAFIERKNFVKRIVLNSDRYSVIHFLYLDPIYYFPINIRKYNKKIKCVGTLHWVPKNILKRIMLKRFCSKLEYIIVHSEYLKKILNEMGINNVKCIDYPSFMRIDVNKYNKNEKIMISCLGGTRFDKGLDILVKSFDYIEDSVKEKIIFNISGIEQDIKFEYIKKNADKNNINVILNNKYLTDKEYENEIIKSDVILLPYRKIFIGNSGPMTDGIYTNKFILGPSEGNLGFLIKKYNLGAVFKQENYIDLAQKISNLPNVDLSKKHKYKSKLTVKVFIEKHEKLYNELEMMF